MDSSNVISRYAKDRVFSGRTSSLVCWLPCALSMCSRWGNRFLLAMMLLISAELIAPAIARAATADQQFADAANYYSKNQWAQAAAELKRFITDFPDDKRSSNARFFLGEALVQLGKYAEAREQFAELLQKEPLHRHSKQALFRLGEAAHFTNDPATAKQALSQFQQQNPDDALNAFAMPYLAEIALGEQDFATARKWFEQALEKYPQSPMKLDCEIGLGTALESLGEFAAALQRYQRVANDPEAAMADEALLRSGVLLYQQKQFAEAAKSLQPFCERFPKSEYRLTACYWLGLAHTANKDWAAVVETLASAGEATKTHPLGPAIEYNAADANRHAGKLAEAAAGYERVIALNPRGDWADDALHQLAQFAFDEAKDEKVLELTEKLGLEFPSSTLRPYTQLLAARSLLRLKRSAETISSLLEGLVADAADNPQLAAVCQQARYQLGFVLLLQKEYEKALVTLNAVEPAADQNELAASVKSARASSLIGLKRTEEAITELEQYLATWPNGPDAEKCRAELAVLQSQSGEPMKAAASFEQLLKDNPNPELLAQAALARALSCEQAGQLEEAFAASQLILEKCPNAPQRPLALFAAARTSHLLQRNEQAAKLFDQLLKEEPATEMLDAVFYHYAWTLTELQKSEEAAAYFQRIVKNYPASRYWPDSAYRCAEAAWRKQDFATAGSLLKEIIAANPEAEILSRALYLQGQIAAQEGRWEACEPVMRRVVTEFPQSSVRLQADYWLAESQFHLGEVSKASERLARLSVQLVGRTDEWCATVPLRHAQLLAQQKKFADAFTVASRIAERYPHFRQQHEVDYVIGRCLASQAKFEEAREAFQRVIQSPRGGATETAAMSQWMIGESFFHQQRYDEAIQSYLKVDQLFTFPQWQAASLLQAGKCRELQGQTKEAAKLYAQLLQKFPDSTYTAEATRRLNVAQRLK